MEKGSKINRLFSFFILGLLATCVSGQVNCPDSTLVSPCVCGDNGDGLTASLNCFARNVNDQRISDILDVFLSPTTRANPIGYLNLGYNPISFIPKQTASLRQLYTAGFGSTDLTTIKNGDFVFTREANLVDFRLNLISTIENGAFQGVFGNASFIYLGNNNLSRFEAGVFKPVLQKIINNGGGYPNGHVWINNNPIDCTTDRCHLAWLIRYNRNLLPAVRDGVCTSGTTFEDLNPNNFNNCPDVFICPDSDGTFANPASCNSFYTCVSSVPYLTQCPDDGNGGQLAFNPNTGRCDKPENVPGCSSGK